MHKIYKKFNLEVKDQSEDNDYFYFSGIASTSSLDRDNDIISSDAYNDNVNKKIKILLNHDMKEPLGVSTSLTKTQQGLMIEAKMPKSDWLVSNRIIPQMKAGTLDSLSIGFIPDMSQITYKDNVRIFNKINIFECSLVTIPANEESKITGMKKFELEDIKEIKSRKEFERFLRDSNVFSKSVCTYLASLCKFQCETDAEIKANKIDYILNTLKERNNGR